ncbi:hypothetical protein B0H17DRAFT_1326338 [Mycena rosella]|uniref:Uncharacterized protein n=1 Tax=Mycena rosella TaxID=1033263 RepID=A0AAD7M8N8_MYCRO|nr:hypothetical protein B0H17DRAFT_1326338 [Mycena rosella]
MSPTHRSSQALSSPALLTPAHRIFALIIFLGTFYLLLHLARRGTRFISEELGETKTVYHDAFVRGILDFQFDSDHALDREFHDVKDEASVLCLSFLTSSPLLIPLMQIMSLVAIAQSVDGLTVAICQRVVSRPLTGPVRPVPAVKPVTLTDGLEP